MVVELMNCPKEIRQCPHGWTDCSFCANVKACDDGTYTPEPEPSHEEDIDVVIKAAEIAVKVVNAEVIKSAESIRGVSWFDGYSKLSYDDRMKEVGKYPTPDLHTVTDPYKAEPGAFCPGGGGKCRVPKKPQRKVPEYMKILGM